MLIRTEAPADILVIDKLVKEVFPTSAEAKLVKSLRENSHLTLSLVACTDDGEIVGHALFSPVFINGEDHLWQGLAPLAVKQEYRGQGIGQRLIEAGLESLYEFGYPVCVVLGDSHYYSRCGFESAEHYDLRCRWNVPQGAFQVRALADGALDSHQGLIEYSPEFNDL